MSKYGGDYSGNQHITRKGEICDNWMNKGAIFFLVVIQLDPYHFLAVCVLAYVNVSERESEVE